MSEHNRRVIASLLDQWRVLDETASALTEEQWLASTALPGWSVQDTFAHVIGTESMLAGRPVPDTASERAPHVRNAIGEMNEAWVTSMRTLTPAEMIAAYREIVDVRTAALTAMGDAELDAPAMTPVGPGTYASFMQIRLFDCWMHDIDIRDAIDLAGEEGGDRADLAFDTFDNALTYVVGKKAQAPDGARILVHLTGPLERTYRVLVDGRARFVPEFDTAETATVTLTSSLYARLSGGRTTASEHREQIAITGDVETGTRIVDSLAVTM